MIRSLACSVAVLRLAAPASLVWAVDPAQAVPLVQVPTLFGAQAGRQAWAWVGLVGRVQIL